MHENHHKHLIGYLNDMLALERDISHAVRGQLEDEGIDRHPGLAEILGDLVVVSEARGETLEKLSKQEGGAVGAAVKGGAMAIAGVLAGLYGKLREHPVSRMVRDDIIALNVAVTGYGMLLTTARCLDHKEAVTIAELGMLACPPLVVRLEHELPGIVAAELAADAPLPKPGGVDIARDAIRQIWQHLPRQ